MAVEDEIFEKYRFKPEAVSSDDYRKITGLGIQVNQMQKLLEIVNERLSKITHSAYEAGKQASYQERKAHAPSVYDEAEAQVTKKTLEKVLSELSKAKKDITEDWALQIGALFDGYEPEPAELDVWAQESYDEILAKIKALIKSDANAKKQ